MECPTQTFHSHIDTSCQDVLTTILNSADPYLCKQETFNESPGKIKHRRFVSEIIYALCTTTIIYLVAGPWVGWDGSLNGQNVLMACGTAVLVKWPLKKSFLKLAPKTRAKRWQIRIYCLIPWRSISRSWGIIAAFPIPRFLRPIVFYSYSILFGVNLTEIEKPIIEYSTISNFFTRRLKSDARKIESCGLLVSPCDGTVVQCGAISDKYVKKVKGLDYCIETFLGYDPCKKKFVWYKHYSEQIPTKTRLYQCVLYLAPGDYHRFHSPCKWKAVKRTHFYGQLLSVAPKVARWMPNLLAINERVVYTGMWEHGFFSYTAVGATNVGSIVVHNDSTLSTNKWKLSNDAEHAKFSSDYQLDRGEEMGFFSMGSTIVLIFEAPENFHFTCQENDHVKLGSCLGGLDYTSLPCDISSRFSDDSDSNDLIDLDYQFDGSEKVLIS